MTEHTARRMVPPIGSDGTSQDRLLETPSFWRRRRSLILTGAGVAAALALLRALPARFPGVAG